MKKIFVFYIVSFFSTISFSQNYPETKKIAKTETKHNISFQDDYSWLENMRSEEVNNWVDKENEIEALHIDQIGTKNKILAKIKLYDQSTSYSLPDKKGSYFYGMYRNKPNKSANLFLMKDLTDYGVEIVSPSEIYPDKNVVLSGYYPSKNSLNLAYKISIDGSDRHEIRFVDLTKNKEYSDVLKNVKFSNVAWNRDQGVFYMKNANQDFFAKDSTFQMRYHKLGTATTDDELIFDGTKNESSIRFYTTKYKLFVIETNKQETEKNYYYADITTNDFTLKKLIDKEPTSFEFINFRNGKIYFSTDENNWGDVRVFEFGNRENETQIIPQRYNHLLKNTFFSENYIICKYKTLTSNYFNFYDYEGNFVKKVDVPDAMDMEFHYFDDETNDFYFGVYSYVLPIRNFKINILKGDAEAYFTNTNRAKATLFPINYFETKVMTYTSRDNQDVPITIIYKKGIQLDGNNPTLLKAYGGFGVVSSPSYDTGLLYFLENGGVFAYAEIRGGGEKGIKWHKDGSGLKKMNCFNDFIDAAEFLIKEKYTNPNKLAITGASQGGLLVGVAITKRPDLFKVAIPKVGVFDMANFYKYTIGRFHFDEYGNPDIEKEFKTFMAYSPYHNVAENINYPTTLIITSDNDDRVPPVHSYKFAAQLQNRKVQTNPIYLKTYKKSGHYGNSSTYEKYIEQNAEFYSFLMYHLNN